VKKVVMMLLLAMGPAMLAAQATAPGPRQATLLTGVGNSLGWFGAQGETYFAGDRLSAFAGLGYTPNMDGNPSGVTLAGGLRGFTGGHTHRGFLELSVSQIAVGYGEHVRLYGPGLQAGWQYVTRGGFTVMASGGVGYILVSNISEPVQLLLGLGLGYTWRRPLP
jgi:hypothetical protein